MSITEQFINERGILFEIERNGRRVSQEKALQGEDAETSKMYFRFLPNADIEVGDWVIGFSNRRFYVTDIVPCSAFGKHTELRVYYQTSAEYNSKTEPPSVSFHIENATNSMIGTQSNFTVNINGSIQEAREQINSSNSKDKEELLEFINLLEEISKNQEPIKQGLLSKFSSVIQRNSWIASPISSIVLNLLLTQVHKALP